MPSTLPAIVSPRLGSASPDLGSSYPDDRGFALSGLTAASAALRGALFEATSTSGRNSPALGGPAGPPSRPLSATTVSFMMSGPGGPLPLPLAGSGSGTTRVSPGAIMGFMGGIIGSTGAVGVGPAVSTAASGGVGAGVGSSSLSASAGGGAGSGNGGTGSSGSGSVAAGVGAGYGLAGEAAHSAAALRAAAEELVEALEVAVRAREAQNKAMLTATRESLGPAAPSSRPASARALDRALTASSRLHLTAFPTASGLTGPATDDRLAWVRSLVRKTEGGQAYAAAAEERERERERGGSGGSGGGAEGGDVASGPVRRGPLPALRPSRREDVLALQTWLTDMMQQVAAEAAAVASAASAAAARPQTAPAATGTAGSSSSSTADGSGGAAAGGGGGGPGPAVLEPGIAAQHAAEVADAALYVVGVAMEELRRQVAAESKERGELLAMLSDQQAGLVALRGALAAEGRVADVAAQWATVLAERDRLLQGGPAPAAAAVQEGGSSPPATTADGASFAATTAAAAASPSVVAVASSLAAQLVVAQQAAASAERRFALADAALAGEAARRAAAEQQLEATRELLRRQEHEWLHHRATNQRLESEVISLRDQLEAATRTAAVAEATVEAARQQTRIGRDDVSQLEAALARMRQQYEGNEILVAAQRQQIRELEGALGALREQHREQAVTLGKVGKVTEQYEETAANLRADLATETIRANELASDLEQRTARLDDVETRLATVDSDLSTVRSQLAVAEETAAKAAAEADAVQRGLRHELADALSARRAEETRRIEVEKETDALIELGKMLARTLQLQGVEGVPGQTDASWELTGPLGATQRVLSLATQHVAQLYGDADDLSRQMRALAAKLAEEKEAVAKLQRDLYDARTIETKMLRDKEAADIRLSALEHDLRVSQSEAVKLRANVQDSEMRIRVQHETIVGLQAQAKELTPLKKRVEALSSDLDVSRKLEEDARSALESTRNSLEQAEEQARYYQGEVHRQKNEVGNLQDQVAALKITAARLGEVENQNLDLDKQVVALKRQLDVAAAVHTETLRQLELARFFLQGLDGNAPASPTRSTLSAFSPMRERSIVGMATIAGGVGSGSGRFGGSPVRGGAPATDSSAPSSAASTIPGGGDPQRPLSAVDVASAGASPARGRAHGSGGGGVGPGGHVSTNRPDSALSVAVQEDGEDGEEGDEVGALGSGGGAGGRTGRNRGSSRVSSAALGGGATRGSRSSSRLNSASWVASRPMSGLLGAPMAPGELAAGVFGDGAAYSPEVSNVVFGLMEGQVLAGRIQRSNDKWSSVKLGIMAWFSKRLRQRLRVVSEELAGKDLEIAQLHHYYLTEMNAREEYIATELLPTLVPVVQSGLKDSARELQALRAEIPLARRDLDALAGSCAVLGFSLQGYRDRRAHAVSRNCQTDSEASDDWSRFAVGLPPLPPRLVLSLGALTEAIVRVYVRAAGTVEDVPTWGTSRHDTIHDAIMAHYTAQRAPGSFEADLIRESDSPVARLLASAQVHARNTKVAMFLYFLNLSPEGVHWPAASWHFLLHVLHCLRVLLSGTWRIVTRRWASPEGVQIPMPAALDLVGNLFNVQTPGELDGAISVRLAAIVTPGSAGPAVDLDALLLLLVREHNAGNCPRNPLLFPRRLTDGQLFNIFNSAGHNSHVEALRSPLVGQYIGPQAPPSPTAAKRGGAPQQGQQAGLGVAAAGPARSGTPSFTLPPLPNPFGGNNGDIMHPYGDVSDPRSAAASAGGSFTAAVAAAAAAPPVDLQPTPIFGHVPHPQNPENGTASPHPPQPPQHGHSWPGPGHPQGGGWPGSGGSYGEGDEVEGSRGGGGGGAVRWELPPASPPVQPSGSMTLSFQITHGGHHIAATQMTPGSAGSVGYGGLGGPGGAGAMVVGTSVGAVSGWEGAGGEGGSRLTALPSQPLRLRK